MSKRLAWETAKPFIEAGTIEYFADHVDFEMTGTNFELYKAQCKLNNVIPLDNKRLTNGYLFSAMFKDMQEV